MSNQNTNHSKSYTRTSAVTRERTSTLFSAHNTNNDEAYLTPERSRKNTIHVGCVINRIVLSGHARN